MTLATAQLSTLTNKVIGEVERAVVGKRSLLEKIMAATGFLAFAWVLAFLLVAMID